MLKLVFILVGTSWLVTQTGCTSLYYSFWETMGKPKRELLRDNVEDVKDQQEEVGEEFQDALTRLQSLYGKADTDLEKVYEQVEDDYQSATKKAEGLSDRIEKARDVAEDLFDEWEEEADTIQNARFRRESLAKLRDMKTKFAGMVKSMEKSERSMEPVLTQLRDHMLYLKHNLNTQALGSLKTEYDNIEREIEQLLKDMQQSIKAANTFLQTLSPEPDLS